MSRATWALTAMEMADSNALLVDLHAIHLARQIHTYSSISELGKNMFLEKKKILPGILLAREPYTNISSLSLSSDLGKALSFEMKKFFCRPLSIECHKLISIN